MLWNHDAGRLDLIHAGIVRIERAGNLVEPNFAVDVFLQFALESVVQRTSPSRSRSSPRASVSPPLAKEPRSLPSPPAPYAAP